MTRAFFFVYHGELALVVGRRFQRVERTVVTDFALPVAVEVVRHHVEEVDVLDHLGNVVSTQKKQSYRTWRDWELGTGNLDLRLNLL